MAFTEQSEAIGSPLFENRRSEWESVINWGKRQEYPVGTIIYHLGEVEKGIIFLQKGLVKQALMINGIEKVIGLYKGGNILGESLFFHQCPSQCIVTAVENTVGYVFSRKTVENLIKNNDGLLSEILKSMSLKTRSLTTQVAIMVSYSAEEKIGKLIYLMAHQEKDSNVVIPLTHQSLADLAGLHRVTVSLILSDFRRKGVIDFKRGCLKIKDREWFNKYVY